MLWLERKPSLSRRQRSNYSVRSESESAARNLLFECNESVYRSNVVRGCRHLDAVLLRRSYKAQRRTLVQLCRLKQRQKRVSSALRSCFPWEDRQNEKIDRRWICQPAKNTCLFRQLQKVRRSRLSWAEALELSDNIEQKTCEYWLPDSSVYVWRSFNLLYIPRQHQASWGDLLAVGGRRVAKRSLEWRKWDLE